ncbi:MAG: holo-ACP synthase [Chlorobi bacterium]|nr:holo-ACP synthase [Chlorobiota bacterium]MCI0716759.1 holo-ACP synthase [Chlorobiota bacterium]
MVKGIGIDIVQVSRIKSLMEKYGDKFFHRILTENEINYCKSFAYPEIHFAGRFASKEAYSKAIGTGISKDFRWKDIEILNDKRGKPYITHTVENEYSKFKFQISISHTKDYGCAVVICKE